MILSTIVITLESFLLFHTVLATDIPFLSNLNDTCFTCLCHGATGCNLTRGCEGGYCGPFKISRIYWKDSGEITLPDDDKERAGAFEDCTFNYPCARKIITNYMTKYGRDCNGDNVTDCDDFLMINFNGGTLCRQKLDRNEFGAGFMERYSACKSSLILV